MEIETSFVIQSPFTVNLLTLNTTTIIVRLLTSMDWKLFGLYGLFPLFCSFYLVLLFLFFCRGAVFVLSNSRPHPSNVQQLEGRVVNCGERESVDCKNKQTNKQKQWNCRVLWLGRERNFGSVDCLPYILP